MADVQAPPTNRIDFLLHGGLTVAEPPPIDSHGESRSVTPSDAQVDKQAKQTDPTAFPHTEPIVAMPISKLVEMIQAICAHGAQSGDQFWLDPEKTINLVANFLVPIQQQQTPHFQHPTPYQQPWTAYGTMPPASYFQYVELASYRTRKYALDAIQLSSFEQGFAVVIAYSKMTVTTLRCERHGHPHPTLAPTERQRNKASKKIGCPFTVFLRQLPNGWYTVEIKNQTHNHPPNQSPFASSLNRLRTEQSVEFVKAALRKGTQPAEIIQQLKDNLGEFAVPKDIYNIKHKMRQSGELPPSARDRHLRLTTSLQSPTTISVPSYITAPPSPSQLSQMEYTQNVSLSLPEHEQHTITQQTLQQQDGSMPSSSNETDEIVQQTSHPAQVDSKQTEPLPETSTDTELSLSNSDSDDTDNHHKLSPLSGAPHLPLRPHIDSAARPVVRAVAPAHYYAPLSAPPLTTTTTSSSSSPSTLPSSSTPSDVPMPPAFKLDTLMLNEYLTTQEANSIPPTFPSSSVHSSLSSSGLSPSSSSTSNPPQIQLTTAPHKQKGRRQSRKRNRIEDSTIQTIQQQRTALAYPPYSLSMAPPQLSPQLAVSTPLPPNPAFRYDTAALMPVTPYILQPTQMPQGTTVLPAAVMPPPQPSASTQNQNTVSAEMPHAHYPLTEESYPAGNHSSDQNDNESDDPFGGL